MVFSKFVDQHVQHLKVVLQVFRDHQLRANKKNCVFGLAQVEYLVHVISASAVATDSVETEAMRVWPTLKSVKQLCSFLGLIGYYSLPLLSR